MPQLPFEPPTEVQAELPIASAARLFAVRLGPGDDLKGALAQAARAAGLQAAFVAACVGSLARARLRMPSSAGEPEAIAAWDEPLEILALSGTLSADGLHLHVALSRRDGACIGGHVLEGCRIRTTAEVVLGELTEARFGRAPDPATGFQELVVTPRAGASASGPERA